MSVDLASDSGNVRKYVDTAYTALTEVLIRTQLELIVEKKTESRQAVLKDGLMILYKTVKVSVWLLRD